MNSDRLKKFEEIYHDALEISPDERESFFAKHCGEDEELRREVGELKTARTLFEESAVIAGEMNDQRQIGHMMNSLGEIARSEKDFQAARKYYEKSRLIAKELNSNESHYPTINLAFVTYLSEDYESSRLYSLEALEISEEFGDKNVIALSLNILAALAMTDDKLEKSARLAGAANAICESTGFKPGPVDQNFIDSYISQARTAINDEAFKTAFAEGSKLSLKEAIAIAREGESITLSKRGNGKQIS